VAADPAENHNLAGKHQDKLIEMIAQWYVEAGKYNVLPVDGSALERLITESSPDSVPAGRHRLRFEFEPTGKPDFAQGNGSPGRAQLYVDGHLVGQAEFPVTTPIAFNLGGLTCGANPGTPVTPAYQAPFRFTGTLHAVTVDLSGDLITDTEAEMRMAMARQ
jgi:hypothetical protein